TKIPLHPKFTLYWKTLSLEQAQQLHVYVQEHKQNEKCSVDTSLQDTLLLLACPYSINEQNTSMLIIEKEYYIMLYDIFSHSQKKSTDTIHNGLLYVQNLVSYTIKDSLGTTIGARMGRPEKAKP